MTPDAHVNWLGFGLPAASICCGPSLSEPSREFQLLLGRPHPPAGAGQGWAVGKAGAAAHSQATEPQAGQHRSRDPALTKPPCHFLEGAGARSGGMGQKRVIARVPFSRPDPFPALATVLQALRRPFVTPRGHTRAPGSAEGRESCSAVFPFPVGKLWLPSHKLGPVSASP